MANQLNNIQGNENKTVVLHPEEQSPEDHDRINWLEDHVMFRTPVTPPKRISWQLAFSPTVNYRKLTGNSDSKMTSRAQNIPMALSINGDIDNLVHHKP